MHASRMPVSVRDAVRNAADCMSLALADRTVYRAAAGVPAAERLVAADSQAAVLRHSATRRTVASSPRHIGSRLHGLTVAVLLEQGQQLEHDMSAKHKRSSTDAVAQSGQP